MKKKFKIIISNLIYSFILFLVIILSIQNTQKKKVNFLSSKSIPLPISFILGTSFIFGSINGALISAYLVEDT